jgi:hypothetical protein
MMKHIISSSILTFFLTSVFAGPKAEFDTKTFNCGTAIEGVTEKIHANFIVKNVGDSVLILTNVKPGCGCTIVKFDSIVGPGKSTTIQSEVNIKGYHSGPISKYITVITNAESEPTRLTIEAIIQAAVDVSENYIRFEAANLASKTVFLSSKKADLKVTNIFFNSDNYTDDPTKKASKLPVKFNFAPTDSTKKDGNKVFKLELLPPKFATTLYGEFVISTNHPDRKELTVRGSLTK